MTQILPVARCLLLLVLLASTAEAAPRRGGWYWWWLRQAAIREMAAAVPDPDPSPVLTSLPPAAPVVAPPAQEVAPFTTASLFSNAVAVSQTAASFSAAPSYYAPVLIPAPTPTPAPVGYAYDALINFGSAPYAGAGSLTTGGAQAWYTSPVVRDLYGGTPDVQQQNDFTATVLQRVEQTFQNSGVSVALTTNGADSAAHTLSVVSGTSYAQNPDAVGITDMGNDGFSFIDKLSYAQNVDQLEWAVAHNVAHELMHAFGVEHHDTTGNYLDGAVASWDMLVNPNSVFGTEAVADLLRQDFKTRFSGLGNGAQTLDAHATGLMSPAPVPEPTTWALWGVAGVLGLVVRHRRRAG